MPAKVRLTSSVAVGQYGAEVAAMPVSRKKAILSGDLRTPSASTGSSLGRLHSSIASKTSDQHPHIDSLLEAVSLQTTFAEIAKRLKMARLEAKRKKVELQIKLEQERERFRIERAQERKRFEEQTLMLQQQMREMEIAHNERMIAQNEWMIAQNERTIALKERERMVAYELELARLKAGQRKVDG